MSTYPRAMYRKTPDGSLENAVVASDAEFEAAGKKGWVDSPAKLNIETAPGAEPDKAIIEGKPAHGDADGDADGGHKHAKKSASGHKKKTH